MPLILPPTPPLSPYVESLWTGERLPTGAHERVLPSGAMHIALRLHGGAVRLYDSDSSAGSVEVGNALVAGVRASFYLKDATAPTSTVGAQLRPGAARALFGVSAADLRDRHVSLDEVWGSHGARLQERLHEAHDPHAQLKLLEFFLLARLRPMRAMHPAIAHGLEQLHAAPTAERLPLVSGMSHRHFIAQFRDATGLSPKHYARVRRFQHLLSDMKRFPERRLADLAVASGYSDQSHCNRDFMEFAGITPHAWRRLEDVRPQRKLASGAPGQFRSRS